MPTVDIKGHQYVLVKDRVLEFNRLYPKGSITTEILSPVESQTIVVKARISPDEGPRIFTGHSQAVIGDGYINKTAALENAETSAVGRALALMGIGVIESIASADEINKSIQYGQSEAPKKKWEAKKIKTDPRVEISGLLKILKVKTTDAQACKDFVLEKTGFELIEANFEDIINTLNGLIRNGTQPFK